MNHFGLHGTDVALLSGVHCVCVYIYIYLSASICMLTYQHREHLGNDSPGIREILNKEALSK